MKNILILTHHQDGHTPPVIAEIRARGAHAYRIHTADFPEEMTLSSTLDSFGGHWAGTLTYQDQKIPLDALSSIWRRRPQKYTAPVAYATGEKAFIEEEADRALLGLFDSLTLQQTFWVSHTHNVRKADLKVLQLAVAQQKGLRVPRTLLTNSPQAVEEFYDLCQGNVILKAVSRGSIENAVEHNSRFIYTSNVEREHLAHLERVRVTAHLFQERIPKHLEVRVVVIGCQVFAAAIYSQHSEKSSLDFRRGYDVLTYDVHVLPDDMRAKVLSLVRHFGLQYASMDCILTPEGEYVFLDLNPNGQFYWLQLRLSQNLPLKEAMADLLVYSEDYCL